MAVEQKGPGGVSASYGKRTTSGSRYDLTKKYGDIVSEQGDPDPGVGVTFNPLTLSISGAAAGAVSGNIVNRRSARYTGGRQLAVPSQVSSTGQTFHHARRAPFPFSGVQLMMGNHTGADISINALGVGVAAALSTAAEGGMNGGSWVGDTTPLVIPANGVAQREFAINSINPTDGVSGYPVGARTYATVGQPYRAYGSGAGWAALYPNEIAWYKNAAGDFAGSNQSAMGGTADFSAINYTCVIRPIYNKRITTVLVVGDSLDAFEYANPGGSAVAWDSPLVVAGRRRQLVGAPLEVTSCAKPSDGYTTFATRARAYIDLMLPDVVFIPAGTPNGLTGTAPTDAAGMYATYRAAKDLANYARSKGAAVVWRTMWPISNIAAGDTRLAAVLSIRDAVLSSGEPVVDVFSFSGGADGRYASAANQADGGNDGLHYSTAMRDKAADAYEAMLIKLGL